MITFDLFLRFAAITPLIGLLVAIIAYLNDRKEHDILGTKMSFDDAAVVIGTVWLIVTILSIAGIAVILSALWGLGI